MRLVARSLGLCVTLLVVGMLAQSTRPAEAAPGDVLDTIPRTYGCYGLKRGVGVAFVPHLGPVARYTCQNPDTDESGPVLFGQYFTFPQGFWQLPRDADGNYIPVEAVTWDPGEQRLWMANRIPVGPSGPGVVAGRCGVWRSLTATDARRVDLAFSFEDPGGGCDFFSAHSNFYDGLAVDPASDTLYLSPANGSTIRHLNKDGTSAANDPIDFRSLTAGLCGGSSCGSAGLLMGVNGHLVSSTAHSGKLIEIDPEVPAVVAVHESGAGRDWGISCGPVYFLPDGSLTNTMLSADLYSENISVLQAPPDICDEADYAARNGRLLSSRDMSAGPGEVAYGVIGFEVTGFGSEVIEAGEMTVTLLINRLEPLASQPPHRIVAAPGDRCASQPVFEFPVPCAEGDAPIPGTDPPEFGPSIGGWACYDHADNDADGLADAADPDCRYEIQTVTFTTTPTGEFQTFYRTFATLCYVPGDHPGAITALVDGPVPDAGIVPSATETSFTFHCAP